MTQSAVVLQFQPQSEEPLSQPKLVPAGKPRGRTHRYYGDSKPSFTIPQLKQFLDAAKRYGQREFSMFVCAFVHGLRASEICSLQVADVNFQTGKIDIHRSKNGNPALQAMQRVNGYDEAHSIELWLKQRALQPGADSPFLFTSQKPGNNGHQLSTVQIWRLFNAICESAGIAEEYRHPHVLRHTLGFLLAQQGHRLESIQQMLGHKNISSTAIYTRKNQDAIDADVAKTFKKLF